ncbi:MAG: transcription antitermination factor NusB [Acetobacterales bacterium]
MNAPDRKPAAAGQGARRAAAGLLDAVLKGCRPLDEVIGAEPAMAALDARDRAFARLLAATTLRRLGEIDALLDRCLEKPLPARAAVARQAMRLGLSQLLFLNTPAHAALDGAARMLSGRAAPYRGVVNAVLRRVTREGDTLRQGIDPDRVDQPDWLRESWEKAYGAATARAISAAHRDEPPLDLTAKADPARWAEALGAELLPTGTLRLREAGPVPELPGFAEGAWWVQDAAAALPVRLLANAFDGGLTGRRAVDLCAAPGGKTAQFAAAGAHVTAVDRSEARLRRVRENLARLGLPAEVVAADAGAYRPPAPPDAVLLDAPCTATGTIRRHPDIAWLKRPDDVAALAAEQSRLLDAALGMLTPGGVLVYAVCSLQPEEGPERIAAVLNTGLAERIPLSPDELPALHEAVTAEGDLRTLPCHWADRGGLDGFYAARLRRL